MLRASHPQNIYFPLDRIPDRATPVDRFFVRDHFDEPALSLSTWKLRIEGRVSHPLELTFGDLLESPGKKVEAVLECAGNTASGFAVGNGLWEGVPLSYLLDKAKPEAPSALVLLEGADSGRLLRNSPSLPYSQVVPLSKCLEPESLVAFKFNDLFLTDRHGFPARALFPGWYAMDSVKWLQRIVVLSEADKPTGFLESGMNSMYVRVIKTAAGQHANGRLSTLLVKSVIAYPSESARLPIGRHSVWGFAWTGNSLIHAVDFSSDGGRKWNPAKLLSSPKPLTWVRWSYSWTAPPGEHLLMSRASDLAGNHQPVERDLTRADDYELNWCEPVRCSVR